MVEAPLVCEQKSKPFWYIRFHPCKALFCIEQDEASIQKYRVHMVATIILKININISNRKKKRKKKTGKLLHNLINQTAKTTCTSSRVKEKAYGCFSKQFKTTN